MLIASSKIYSNTVKKIIPPSQRFRWDWLIASAGAKSRHGWAPSAQWFRCCDAHCKNQRASETDDGRPRPGHGHITGFVFAGWGCGASSPWRRMPEAKSLSCWSVAAQTDDLPLTQIWTRMIYLASQRQPHASLCRMPPDLLDRGEGGWQESRRRVGMPYAGRSTPHARRNELAASYGTLLKPRSFGRRPTPQGGTRWTR